jgi:hypothetical protein
MRGAMGMVNMTCFFFAKHGQFPEKCVGVLFTFENCFEATVPCTEGAD